MFCSFSLARFSSVDALNPTVFLMETLYKEQSLELRELLLPATVLQKVYWVLRSLDSNY